MRLNVIGSACFSGITVNSHLCILPGHMASLWSEREYPSRRPITSSVDRTRLTRTHLRSCASDFMTEYNFITDRNKVTYQLRIRYELRQYAKARRKRYGHAQKSFFLSKSSIVSYTKQTLL